MMAKEVPVFYFCIILSCFPDNGAGKTWNQGPIFCLVHLPTDKNTGPSLLAKLQSDDLWAVLQSSSTEACVLTCRPRLCFAPWETVSEQKHCIQDLLPAKVKLTVLTGTSVHLSACLTFDVCPFLCVLTRPNVIAPDNILP